MLTYGPEIKSCIVIKATPTWDFFTLITGVMVMFFTCGIINVVIKSEQCRRNVPETLKGVFH